MAEVQQNTGDSGKKGQQKKMTIRVDFTPMVDMNMLLITFFMLCTTMIKSQTLSISLPSNLDVKDETQQNQASADEAITIIIDSKRKPGTTEVDSVNHNAVPVVYYYFGKPANGVSSSAPDAEIAQNSNLKISEFLSDDAKTGKSQGIRAIIQERNQKVLEEIEKLKQKRDKGGFGSLETKEGRAKAKEAYDAAAKEVRNNKDLKPPTIIIKATPQASYGSLVQILDEMQINSIAKYQIDNMTHIDSVMVKKENQLLK